MTYSFTLSGSSPRMRGARCGLHEEELGSGIIPAYAGSTPTARARPTPTRDHPRVCGEHCVLCGSNFSALGSSPRMRGAQPARPAHAHDRGIIPAYAGSTQARRNHCGAPRDHPRVCGEHLRSSRALMVGEGSSPRMRGALRDGVLDLALLGIIPAYAGSTSASDTVACCLRDHPRVCGEHHAHRYDIRDWRGSSPRMRGARPAYSPMQTGRGIIPAYAGSTALVGVLHVLCGDHPRVCGEHTSRSASLR